MRAIVDLWFRSTHTATIARAIFSFVAGCLGGEVVRGLGVVAASMVTLGAYALSGCVQVPVRDGVAAADINSVVRRIKCDLSEVVLRKAYSYDEYGQRPFLFLRSWAAKIHLTLIVDDMGQINPGAQYTTPLHAVSGVTQSFSLGIGGGLTTQVQRQEDVEFLLSFKDIDKQHHDGELYTPLYHYCQPEPGLLLESDLGLQAFVDAALKPVETRILVPGNNIGPNVGPPTAIPRSDYSLLATEPPKPPRRTAAARTRRSTTSLRSFQKIRRSPDNSCTKSTYLPKSPRWPPTI
jgi:hypothetical protein